jgi:hypothetical protein
VEKYVGFHDELYAPQLVSGYPYNGVKWSSKFKKISGRELWKLKDDGIANDLTADLIAAAEKMHTAGMAHNEGAAFGGSGTSGSSIWVAFLDGGLLVNFTLSESERTNALSGTQKTMVGGAMCFRYLLHQLGFDSVTRRIGDEQKIPTISEMNAILAQQHQRGTPQFEQLQLSASLVPDWARELTE